MKRLKKVLLLVGCVLFLSGCGSESQSLAKNLDDTITNLVYTVSSLDWVDDNIVANLNNDDYGTDNANIYSLDADNLSQRNTNQNTFGGTNIQSYQTPLQENSTPQSPSNMEQYRMTDNAKSTYNYPNTLSGSLAKREALSKNTISKISTKPNQSNAMKYLSVAYSTTEIESSNEIVKQKIAELIERRGNLIMYVNALYNGNIKLSSENITAINAYINIIKDNTSYLKSNKGMVINQLTHANSLKQGNSFSPLINAYIIRTSEAINTRIAKLDASNLAIDSIIDILDNNIDQKLSLSLIGNKTQSNQTTQERTDNIDNKIITENKNANNATNNAINKPLMPYLTTPLQNSGKIYNNLTDGITNIQNDLTNPQSRQDIKEDANYNLQIAQNDNKNSNSDVPNCCEKRKSEDILMENNVQIEQNVENNASLPNQPEDEQMQQKNNIENFTKKSSNDKIANDNVSPFDDVELIKNADIIKNAPFTDQTTER